jgi:hypothetical protein
MVDNAERAICEACSATGSTVSGYTAAPLYKLDKAKGCHQWLVEFEKAPSSLSEFTRELDASLQRLNSDYEAKRYREISLQLPEVIVGRRDVFHDWLRSKGRLGGQHKVPRLSNTRELIEELMLLNSKG